MSRREQGLLDFRPANHPGNCDIGKRAGLPSLDTCNAVRAGLSYCYPGESKNYTDEAAPASVTSSVPKQLITFIAVRP